MKKNLHIQKHSTMLLCMAIFLGVFLILYLQLPYTMKFWESECFYIDSPDYKKEIIAASHSYWDICINYCRQFFYYRWAGPAIFVATSTLLFALLCKVIRKFSLRVVMGIIILTAAACIVWNPNVQKNEQWRHMEYAAENHRWNEVLSIATPERCKANRNMLPYALLALAANHQIAEQMFEYPVESIQDFDTYGENTREYYFFKMVLYDCLGCPNEAIHNAMQAAAISSPYGMTLGTLRRLVRFYRATGNNAVADKIVAVLSKSTLHANWHTRNEEMDSENITTNQSGQEALITESLGYNIGMMLNNGIGGPIAVDYFLCQLLVNGNLNNFVKALQRIYPDSSVPLPSLYREALQRYRQQHPENISR